MSGPLRVVVVGPGQMGRSHALAYRRDPASEIVGLVNRSPAALPAELSACPRLDGLAAGLALKPDLVCIATHADSNAALAIEALEAGAHVFVEKPLVHRRKRKVHLPFATTRCTASMPVGRLMQTDEPSVCAGPLAPTLAEAKRTAAAARAANRKLVVGHILRHHPSWRRFVAEARRLGPPFVLRMNLNQQSSGTARAIHGKLLHTTSPVVDCGAHHVDVMLQITDSPPVQVRGMGVRLSDEIAPDQVNYGHLQVLFADRSVGWYEAGRGPMMSETAFFVKDVMGPRGAVSIVMDEGAPSADLATHTRTSRLRVHGAATGPEGRFLAPDTLVPTGDEPDHDALCGLQQRFVLDAIREDRDLGRHMTDALRSLAVVLAADRSMRENRAVDLPEVP